MKTPVLFLTTIALIIFLGAIGSTTNYFRPKSVPTQTSQITISGATIKIEVVDNDKSRERGLSGRQNLAPNHGMFFIFDYEDYWAFWMPDMRFAIDIIWLDKNLRVVDIAKSVAPETYPKTFKPAGKATYVLEVNSGFSDTYHTTIGDQAIVTK